MCGAVFAETAQFRISWGNANEPEREELRTIELKRIGESHLRAVVPKDEIPADATCVSIVPSFMTARKGDAGWWMQARGTYGCFDKSNGRYDMWRQLMPVFAVKRGDMLWYAHVKTWRFNYDFVLS